MPELFKVFERLKAIQREHSVLQHALLRLGDEVLGGWLSPQDISPRDFEAARRELEPTYLVRLWAEFETALRSYRRHVTHNPEDNIRARNLIDWAQGVEEGRKVAAEYRDLVHEVREYRNSLVHARDDPAPAVNLDEARRRLNTFLSRLPERW